MRGGPHFDPVVQAPSRKSINRVGVEKIGPGFSLTLSPARCCFPKAAEALERNEREERATGKFWEVASLKQGLACQCYKGPGL